MVWEGGGREAPPYPDPYSLSVVRLITALVHYYRHEQEEMQEHLEACLALAREHNLPFMMALGLTFHGWLMAAQGDCRAGITQIRQGLQDYQAIRGELGLPHTLSLLADAYRRDGQVEEGLKVMDEAMEALDRTGERIWEPEAYRLRAELFLQRAVPDAAQAEHDLLTALEAARRMSAKTLELRAALDLSRLWQQQGKQPEAHQVLSTVSEAFTEGADTVDLQAARALLAELT